MNAPRFSWLRPGRPHAKHRHLAAPPGSLVHVGARRTEKTQLTLAVYRESSVEIADIDDLPEVEPLRDPDSVAWLHVSGLHEVETLSRIGKAFDISALVLEDILNTRSRPKIEKREDEVFVVVNLLTSLPEDRSIDVQQLSLLLLRGNILLSFLEGPTRAFDPVIERIQTNRGGRIRKFGADYLAWALLDAVVDNYLHVIDQLDEAVVEMDNFLQTEAEEVEAAELYTLKRDIGQVYRAIRPIREITSSLQRSTTSLLREESEPFFTDLNDHAVQVMETTEYLRESSSALRDFYLSAVSNRMNEVMKVLTCFSTIFLPLTFLAGVYGMNFAYMPELQIPWAYPALWVVFGLCAAGMFWLFRRKNWL